MQNRSTGTPKQRLPLDSPLKPIGKRDPDPPSKDGVRNGSTDGLCGTLVQNLMTRRADDGSARVNVTSFQRRRDDQQQRGRDQRGTMGTPHRERVRGNAPGGPSRILSRSRAGRRCGVDEGLPIGCRSSKRRRAVGANVAHFARFPKQETATPAAPRCLNRWSPVQPGTCGGPRRNPPGWSLVPVSHAQDWIRSGQSGARLASSR